MKKKFSKNHVIFMAAGAVFCITSVVLSFFNSVSYESFNGWTGGSVNSVGGFMTEIILWAGIIELLFLIFRNAVIRILSVFVSAAKLFLPWFLFNALNSIGTATYDASFESSIFNSLPLVISVFSALSLINAIYMAVVLIRENNRTRKANAPDKAANS